MTEINPPPNEQGFYLAGATVHLSVEKIYRGNLDGKVVDDQRGGGSCKIVYEKGKRYLLYAFDYNSAERKIATSVCSRSAEISSANEDIDYINKLGKGSLGASISGKVLKNRYDALEGIRVEAEGDGKTYGSKTNKEGRFTISLPRSGKYKVRAYGPPNSDFFSHRDDGRGYAVEGRPVIEFEEEIQRGGCAYIEFNLFVDESEGTP